MRQIFVFVVAGFLSLGILGSVSAQEKQEKPKAAAKAGGNVEDQLKKIEEQRTQAVVKGDVATLEKLTSDDYTFINRFGQVSDKTKTMDAIKNGDIKLTSNKVSDLNVRVYGNTAVITGRAEGEGKIFGKDASGPVLFTRVYVKKNGRWQSVAFQQTAAEK